MTGIVSGIVSFLLPGIVVFLFIRYLPRRPYGTAGAAARRLGRFRSGKDLEVPARVYIDSLSEPKVPDERLIEITWKARVVFSLRSGAVQIHGWDPTRFGDLAAFFQQLADSPEPTGRGKVSVRYSEPHGRNVEFRCQADDLRLLKLANLVVGPTP